MNKKLFTILAVIIFSALVISGCNQGGVDVDNPENVFKPPSQEGSVPEDSLAPPEKESGQSVEKVIAGPVPVGPAAPADLDPSGWQPFIDEEWSYQLLIPTDWVYDEMDLENPNGPTFEFWKREVMFMPESMAKIIAERSGPPGPDDPPTYPSIIVDVILGSMEEYRILHVEPLSSETIEINGLLVEREDRYGQTCYVFQSPSNPDLIVTLTDSINGFPQRMEGNEDLLAQIEMVIASFEFIGPEAPVLPVDERTEAPAEDIEPEDAGDAEPVDDTPAGEIDEPANGYTPLGKAFYREDFSSPEWYERIDTNYGFSYTDSGYRIYNNIYGGVIWSIRQFEHWNVIVQTQAYQVGGPENGYYGVVCRYKDEDNYYAFVVGENGFFGIVRWLKGEHSFLKKGYLDESSRFELLEPGEKRIVAGECIDDNLRLFLNGELLAEVHDKSFDSGYIGMAVGTSSHPGVEVEFTRFEAGIP